jgi:DNA-binding NarL/FixJ family response regulator
MSHSDVTSAIRSVHAGLRFIPASVSRRLAERPPCSELSPRELDVLRLIARGQSNREIGGTLGITEATVKWHVNIILGRLGVNDRTEAIVAALRRGIIEMP